VGQTLSPADRTKLIRAGFMGSSPTAEQLQTVRLPWTERECYMTRIADAAVIPDLASMKYFVRAPTAKAVVALREKIIPCFEWVLPIPASRRAC
jgi:hypothetical protein